MGTFFLLLCLFGLVAATGVLSVNLIECTKSRKQAEGSLAKISEEAVGLHQRVAALSAEVAQLAPFRGVVNVKAQADEMLRNARQSLERATADSQAIVGRAASEAQAICAQAHVDADAWTSQARGEAQGVRNQTQAIVDEGQQRAQSLIDEADKKAREIAGSALDALENAKLHERTVRAMKNIIEGYGNQYLRPAHSLLDDLAEDFGFTEAGQQLKSARELTRRMIANGTAGVCDYVEENRRATAVAFVVDAFNGKVDSILSRVKSDNAGTLEQEIRDAIALVNYNGKAFRDARITDAYLLARLDELKWGAVGQQLRVEEREEQRRIREQMREEAKARREYERTIRETAKEEDVIRRAMQRAQEQFDKASDEQRAKYEQQLQDLSGKLAEAEERNKRALSMAQQTKRGHVYVISNVGSFGEGVFKIGMTRRLEPLDRVRELGDSSVPFEFDVHAMILSDDAPALERRLHQHFVLLQVNKVNYRKEFFRVGIQHVNEEVTKLGLEAKWTMAAAAREYYESQNIEKAIEDDPVKRQAWINRQLELDPLDYQLDEGEEEGEGDGN